MFGSQCGFQDAKKFFNPSLRQLQFSLFDYYLLSALMNNSNKIYDYITGLYNRQKRTPPKTCVLIVGGVEFTFVLQ